MLKSLKRIKLITFIATAIEVLGVVLLMLMSIYNWFGLKEFLTIEIIFCILAGVVVVDFILIWIFIFRISYVRQRSDLTAAELIGTDVNEAYNFGMIGLVVCDDNFNVLWINELLKERKFSILDKNILDWQPALRELLDGGGENTAKIIYNSRNYEVRYLSDAKLYIFKDITDLESITNYSIDQSVSVGIIMIDNYRDVSGNLEDANDVISKVRNEIFEYAKEFGVLLRRYRNDAYFAICNHVSLENMKKDRFSILEKVRIIGAKEDTPPTLSIGFAHDFPDVNKLNDMAGVAIDIAMSRGGDQAVVSKYGEELLFFGGKTEAMESRNKVEVRVIADSLINAIKSANNILIMGHTDADMDAIGSCLGILAICNHVNKEAHIVYDSKHVERKAKNAFSTLFSRDEIAKMTLMPKEALEKVRSNTLIIVVDVHKANMTMSPAIIEKASKVIVIDHHRRGEDFIENDIFHYIEPSASSASELITELIRYASVNPRIELKSSYATLMLSGIFLDSNYFKAKTTAMRTFEASMILKEYGADNSLADDFLKDEYEEYSLISSITSTMKTPYYGVVYCMADEKEIIEPATLAKVANSCMQIKGVNGCFVIGRVSDNTVRISARSNGKINMQLLAEKMGGGGHFTSAAVPLKNYSLQRAESYLMETLATFLPDASQHEDY